MSENIWIAIGLFFVIEGLIYALVPRQLQEMMKTLQNLPPEQLRMVGAISMAIGVFVIFLVKQFSV